MLRFALLAHVEDRVNRSTLLSKFKDLLKNFHYLKQPFDQNCLK